MSFQAKNGTITVSGTVQPGTDIEKVTRAIEAVPNVTAVVNKLRVLAGTTTQ
jgi:osmotically-inducible protein OsmY